MAKDEVTLFYGTMAIVLCLYKHIYDKEYITQQKYIGVGFGCINEF